MKAVFGADSYTVSVTDLSRIWSERLERGNIVERAAQLESPIDVGTDEQTQISLLLEHVQKTVQGEAVANASHLTRDGDALVLRTATRLPEPLGTLKWRFCLQREDDSALRRHLVVPLLASSFAQKECVDSLVEMLNEKDKVISRLVSRIEANGIALCTVFPALAASRNNPQRKHEQAVKTIPGLASFDERSWRDTFQRLDPFSSSLASLAQAKTFDDVILPSRCPSGVGPRPSLQHKFENAEQSVSPAGSPLTIQRMKS